jgi:hypothetical protein
MDSLDNFSPLDTSMFLTHNATCFFSLMLTVTIAGFIQVNAIRLKKYGLQKIDEGKPLSQEL